jgi:hypothetical protein
MISPGFSEICTNVSPDRTVQYGGSRRAIAWLEMAGFECVAAPSREVVTTADDGHQRYERGGEKGRCPAAWSPGCPDLHRRGGVHRVERSDRRVAVQVPHEPADRLELAATRQLARDLVEVRGRTSGDHHAGAPRIDVRRCVGEHFVALARPLHPSAPVGCDATGPRAGTALRHQRPRTRLWSATETPYRGPQDTEPAQTAASAARRYASSSPIREPVSARSR